MRQSHMMNTAAAMMTALTAAIVGKIVDPKLAADLKRMGGGGFSLRGNSGGSRAGGDGWRSNRGICAKVRKGRVQARARRRASR